MTKDPIKVSAATPNGPLCIAAAVAIAHDAAPAPVACSSAPPLKELMTVFAKAEDIGVGAASIRRSGRGLLRFLFVVKVEILRLLLDLLTRGMVLLVVEWNESDPSTFDPNNTRNKIIAPRGAEFMIQYIARSE